MIITVIMKKIERYVSSGRELFLFPILTYGGSSSANNNKVLVQHTGGGF